MTAEYPSTSPAATGSVTGMTLVPPAPDTEPEVFVDPEPTDEFDAEELRKIVSEWPKLEEDQP